MAQEDFDERVAGGSLDETWDGPTTSSGCSWGTALVSGLTNGPAAWGTHCIEAVTDNNSESAYGVLDCGDYDGDPKGSVAYIRIEVWWDTLPSHDGTTWGSFGNLYAENGSTPIFIFHIRPDGSDKYIALESRYPYEITNWDDGGSGIQAQTRYIFEIEWSYGVGYDCRAYKAGDTPTSVCDGLDEYAPAFGDIWLGPISVDGGSAMTVYYDNIAVGDVTWHGEYSGTGASIVPMVSYYNRRRMFWKDEKFTKDGSSGLWLPTM